MVLLQQPPAVPGTSKEEENKSEELLEKEVIDRFTETLMPGMLAALTCSRKHVFAHRRV